ncbi:MAG: DMT family transporter [Paludibacteraceae bacterium]|nr:DMT family transporter [Paludibacteraceae bacterium]
MWTVFAFISALCLGCYDVSKKIALRDLPVISVLTFSILFSSAILAIPLVLSTYFPETMAGTLLYVPKLDWQAHLYTLLKSVIVLSSWIFAYISLKHLPISVVSPMQATRPMWTLIGALLLFEERLNSWQWAGVLLAIGTIFVFSFRERREVRRDSEDKWYYICLALAILIGACSGLYDKYLMRRYDHNAVQVWYTFYQAAMMLIVFVVNTAINDGKRSAHNQPKPQPVPLKALLPVLLISVFLVISDNVYMLALRDPDSMIAVVSTIRRGGAVIGFAYGLLFLHEANPWRKVLCMIGICAGLICLAIGAA